MRNGITLSSSFPPLFPLLTCNFTLANLLPLPCYAIKRFIFVIQLRFAVSRKKTTKSKGSSGLNRKKIVKHLLLSSHRIQIHIYARRA